MKRARHSLVPVSLARDLCDFHVKMFRSESNLKLCRFKWSINPMYFIFTTLMEISVIVKIKNLLVKFLVVGGNRENKLAITPGDNWDIPSSPTFWERRSANLNLNLINILHHHHQPIDLGTLLDIMRLP